MKKLIVKLLAFLFNRNNTFKTNFFENTILLARNFSVKNIYQCVKKFKLRSFSMKNLML